MLDEATFSRDLTNCIADAPSRGRHRGREVKLHISTADDMYRAVESGIEDNMSISVIANADDFGNMFPKPMDDFEILVNGRWITFQIASTPDYYHTGISAIYQINLQSPQKGVA